MIYGQSVGRRGTGVRYGRVADEHGEREDWVQLVEKGAKTCQEALEILETPEVSVELLKGSRLASEADEA